jgi:hypothetical protein
MDVERQRTGQENNSSTRRPALTGNVPPQISDRNVSRMKAAHSVDSAPRRRRRGAKVNTFERGTIRRGTQNGASNQLPQIVGASSNTSSNQVWIDAFQLAGRRNVAGQDAVFKFRSKPAYFPLKWLRHIP